MERQKTITIKVSNEEKKALENIAKKNNITVSEYLRRTSINQDIYAAYITREKVRPIIKKMATCINMYDRNYGESTQLKSIVEEGRKLCALLK